MQSEQVSSDKRWISMLRKQLQDAEIELVAHFAQTRVSLGDVLRLKPGDIIPINVHETITVEVDRTTLMDCRYGQHNGRYALKIEQFKAPESADPIYGVGNG